MPSPLMRTTQTPSSSPSRRVMRLRSAQCSCRDRHPPTRSRLCLPRVPDTPRAPSGLRPLISNASSSAPTPVLDTEDSDNHNNSIGDGDSTSTSSAHTEEARVAANTRLAHWEAAKRALHHPLLARATRVSRTPRRAAHWTANSDAAGSIAEDRRAILGRAFPFNGGTTPPHPRNGRPPLGAAMSQPPPGTPIGKQSSGSSATPPAHPTRVPHTRRSAAQRRAIQMRRQHGRGPVRHIGARVPHHRERAHRTDARRQGAIAALQPCLRPLLPIPPPPFLTIAAANATTREWRDHPTTTAP